nr:hypothetical protein B0A51_17578 [Rachicladosporium sp. CCFEE 5018]
MTSIENDELVIEDEKEKSCEDLVKRLLETDSKKRITIDEMRGHDWITNNGEDPLLSVDENCADQVEPFTEIEINQAITGNTSNLMSIMGATTSRAFTLPADDNAKGYAHHPLLDTAFLNIGADAEQPDGYGSSDHPVVSESPPTVDMNIYEQAYQEETKRILEAQGQQPAMHLNRRGEPGKVGDRMGWTGRSSSGGFAKPIRQAKERQDAGEEDGGSVADEAHHEGDGGAEAVDGGNLSDQR